MKKSVLLFSLCFLCVLTSVASDTISITSPDKNLVCRIFLTGPAGGSGNLYYELNYKDKAVIKKSALGINLKSPALQLNTFDLVEKNISTTDESWTPVWGEVKQIRNNYQQLFLRLKTKDEILVNMVFKLFNDGVGFRYEFPQQAKLKHFIIAEETTQFAVTGDHKTFWIPGDYDTNEYAYYTSKLSEIDATGGKFSQEIHAKTYFNTNGVQTPLMMKTGENLYINIHEAALVNYPAMNLVIDKSSNILNAHLVPDAVGNKAYLQTPSKTPWRTVIVSDKATDILASKMILNLNEPSKIVNISWIKPQKFVGVWWELHVGKSSWDYSGSQVGSQQATRVPHGANTANVKKYIDFAAKHGIDAVLVEGWNAGWEDWFGNWKEDVFDFVTPYPDFDVKEITAYAKLKNVQMIMHHETSSSVSNYERWMDTAYRFMKNNGYNAVKSGYVGQIIPRGEHHDGQWMIKHYERAIAKAAGYQIMVDQHEPVRPTGLHRTYPNYLACEAARGNEFNAWSSGNPPDHETILPFTRLMGGPMDYTPGIFKIKMNFYDTAKKEQVHTTLAKQLALYVTMYSPLQMAADLPENYERHLDAFQFIKDVAVDWDDTKIIEAEPGDYISIARKAKNKDDWFIGAITDENSRTSILPLNFLDAGKKYLATLYKDADDAHWKNNPEAYAIEKFMVDAKTILKLKLSPGGGAAISILPVGNSDIKSIKNYK
ncbi:MAG: glycoside hydrolase family 97 protein [Chitinophagaceae bacterium]|nr:glycoside hydrolase family 97 protein [Chitinophagaceae bacterium]